MSRTKFFDFRAPDSTSLFNNRFRAILQSGVYAGFNVGVGGSGGLNLKFTHDSDPDNTGSVLGKLVMPDGIMVEENADQDDVIVGSLSGGLPNIHYVVASYTYNASLPNNDVVYSVLQGTSGSPPTPPTLTDDQILLAEIDVPSGTTAYTNAGVSIKTVAKKDLYSSNLKVIKDFLGDILKSGIYDGIEMSEGSTNPDITLSDGSWVTKEFRRITEPSVQTDIVTLTAPSSGNHKLSWLIGLHKVEETDPPPSAEYILVQGADASLTAAATIPTDVTIQAAAFAANAKYDDNADSLGELIYINKLGIIRSENRGGTVTHQYVKGETYLEPDTLRVYSATAKTEQRSGQYFGMLGLRTALTAAHSATLNNEDDKPRVVEIDGEFLSDGSVLEIPSGIHIKGINNARIGSDLVGNTVQIEGKTFEYDTVNDTIATPGVGGGTAPAGFDAKSFSIEATYQTGDNLNDKKFARGDRVLLYDNSSATFYEGTLYEVTGDWTFDAFVEVQYGIDGNEVDLDITIFKTNAGLLDVEIYDLGSGNAKLSIESAEKTVIERSVCGDLNFEFCNDSDIRSIEVTGTSFSWLAGNGSLHGNLFTFRNVVGEVKFTGAITGTPSFGLRDQDGKCGRLILKNSSANPNPFYVYSNNNSFGEIKAECALGTVLRIDSKEDCTIGIISNTSPTGNSDVDFYSNTRMLVGSVEATDQLHINTNTSLTIVNAKADNLSDVVKYLGGKNRILNSSFSGTSSRFGDALSNPDHDKNLRLASDANISFDATTGQVSWDDDILFVMPWTNQAYNRVNVTSSPQTLAEEEMLIAVIDRDIAAATTADVPFLFTVNVNGRISEAFKQHSFVLALRKDNVVYFWDGTRVEDGQTVKIGSTPPPDESVTHSKLATSAIAIWNSDPLMNYVTPVAPNGNGWDDDVIVRNTGLLTFTYTAASGIIQYSGAIDLSSVRVGDTLLLRNQVYNPPTASQGAYPREEILAVNDVGNSVTIAAGLDPNIGAANIWNGAIVRGNKVVSNDGLVTYSYDPNGTNPGRVTYASGLDFSAQQVKVGYVWKDSSGQKFRIIDLDSSGNGDWLTIAPGLRHVDTSTPTTKEHGSIETNNNPRNLKLADLSPLGGMEFVPVDYSGPRMADYLEDVDLQAGDNLYLLTDLTNGTMHTAHPIPFDERVVLAQSAASPLIEIRDDSGGNEYFVRQDFDWVSITAVCTGIILVLDPNGSTGGQVDVYVDGELFPGDLTDNEIDHHFDNTFTYNAYNLAVDDSPAASRILRLPLGIHTIRFAKFTGNVRGFAVIKNPQESSTAALFSDSPGIGLIRGGQVIKTAPNRGVGVPVPGSGWNKGGRMVRYIDKDGSYNTATRFLRNFTDTGDVATGSNTIGNVAVPTQWRVGDIIMTISGTKKYLRRITSISGTSLVCGDGQPNFDYNQTTATLYYYGQTHNGTLITLSGVNNRGPHHRPEEVIAQKLSTLDFGAPSGNLTTSSISFRNGQNNTFDRGERLSDLTTGIAFEDNTLMYSGGEIQIAAAGKELRITFVGTGLSLDFKGGVAQDLNFFVDGVEGGVVGTTLTNPGDTEGGIYICGELPYGQHTVRFLHNQGSPRIKGFTVFQPKKPVLPSADEPVLELWDTNLVAFSDEKLNIDSQDQSSGSPQIGVDVVQIGTIAIKAARMCHTDGVNNFLRSIGYDFETQTSYPAYDCINTAGVGKILYFPFFGNEATLVTSLVSIGSGGTWDVTLLDNDGVFRAPGSTTGFTSTGPTSYSATDGTDGLRKRWTMRKFGVHVIRLISTTSGDLDMEPDVLEVHTPFHTHRTKEPTGIDVWMPYMLAGLDVRPMSPLSANSQQLDIGRTYQSAWFQSDGTFTTEDFQGAFWFYSSGGLVEITAQTNVRDTVSASHTVGLVVDGESAAIPLMVGVVPAASDSSAIAMRKTLYLKQGMHFAYLILSANGQVSHTTWSAQMVGGRGAGLPDRGHGVPFIPQSHHSLRRR